MASVQARVRSERGKARVGLRVIADVRREHGQAVQSSGSLARDRHHSRLTPLGDLRRGVACRRGDRDMGVG